MHTLLAIGTSLPGDELYELAPEEFVAARDRLVRELRAQGNKDEARAVAALRRPSVAAWALNRAARARPDDIDELLKAGQALQKGSGSFREAMDSYRDVARSITAVAAEALRGSGREPDSVSAEIRGTLDAAAGDPELAETLRAGRLERTAQAGAAGFSLAGAPGQAPQPSAAEEKQRERRERAEADVRQRREELAEAKEAVRVAGQAVRTAERELRAAERDRDRAQQALERAQRKLTQ